MVVKRRSRNTGRTKKILNRSSRRTKRVRKKKYSRKSKRRKTRKTRNQRGGDTLEYFVPQTGWVNGEITYNGDGSITVNDNVIHCGEYQEWPTTSSGRWQFLQPLQPGETSRKYKYIKPKDPSNITDLLDKWGC